MFLAGDGKSPYVDIRANWADALETWYYVAQYLPTDALVGKISDVLVVMTVRRRA